MPSGYGGHYKAEDIPLNHGLTDTATYLKSDGHGNCTLTISSQHSRDLGLKELAMTFAASRLTHSYLLELDCHRQCLWKNSNFSGKVR